MEILVHYYDQCHNIPLEENYDQDLLILWVLQMTKIPIPTKKKSTMAIILIIHKISNHNNNALQFLISLHV